MASAEWIIKSEDDAWDLMEKLLLEEGPTDFIKISFNKWPNLEIKLDGEHFNSSITPKVMESFIALQKGINSTYTLLRHNTGKSRNLTNEERHALEVVVKVNPGCSDLRAFLDLPLSKIAEGVVTNMNGSEMVIAILGCAALYAGTTCFKSYLQNQKEKKDSDTLISMTNQETKRMEIFSQALQQSPQLKTINTEAEDVYNSILKGAATAKSIQVAGLKLAKSEVTEILRTSRTKSQDTQLNGEYKVLAVDSANPDHYKVDLEFEDGREFTARLDQQFLATKEQNRKYIESALWDRSSIYLLVNATELRGDVTKATIIDVRDRYMKGMHDIK